MHRSVITHVGLGPRSWHSHKVRHDAAMWRRKRWAPSPSSESDNQAIEGQGSALDADGFTSIPAQHQSAGFVGWLEGQLQRRKEIRSKLATLGLAAVLAYGLLDGVSKTVMFSIAFLCYEAKTGLNPARNLADLVRVYVLMWAGSNMTRPFRLAWAAALAPLMDKVMDSLQKRLRLPSKSQAFVLVVAAVAGTCLSVVGALFMSRWVRG